jgi:hypothetical protein
MSVYSTRIRKNASLSFSRFIMTLLAEIVLGKI